jgi:hypothetical protein
MQTFLPIFVTSYHGGQNPTLGRHHGRRFEASEVIEHPIGEATKFAALEQPRSIPECRRASTEEGQLGQRRKQWRKLRALVDLARNVWREAHRA